MEIKKQRVMETGAGILFAAGWLIGSLFLSGCHATIATPSAIREYHRGLNGMISEGKASPDKEGAYWQTQKLHDGLRLGGE